MRRGSRLVDSGLVDTVRATLLDKGVPPTKDSVTAALRAQGRVVDETRLWRLVEEVRSDLTGFGPLDPWVAAPGVTDILVNGPDDVWVDRGDGVERVAATFRDESAVRRLLQRLVTSAGRRIDDAQPYVDVQLPSRIRLHAVLPPLCDRLSLSLRIARRTAFTLDELVLARTVAPDLAPVLHQLVDQRLSFLVCGGTGCGKTTILAALLGITDPCARIVIVEDTAELAPDHPHVVKLETRRSNIEGRGAVSMAELVRQALRMRPDRLVVGEARGAEVVDLLAALNTGHEGGCGTLHANTAAAVPARVEALCAAGGMAREAAHSQLAAALDVVVEVDRRADRTRFVRCIAVLQRSESGLVETLPAWLDDGDGVLRTGPGLGGWNQLTRRAR